MRKGLSLIEALVTLAIFSIAILGIGSLLTYNLRFGAINTKRDETLYKTNTVLEYLAALNYTDSCLAIGTNRTCDTDTTGACCDGEAGNRNIRWIVNSYGNNTKEITLIGTFNFQNYTGNVTLTYIKGNWQ